MPRFSREFDSSDAKDFARDHWKEMLAVSGTLAGAAILLLIRYYRRKNNNQVDSEFDIYEGEATGLDNDTSVLLTTGVDVAKQISDVEEITNGLANGLPDEKSQEVMRTVGKLRNSR